MTAHRRVRVWPSLVPGVVEVLHAEWRDHEYPVHTHDTWTLLIVDDGLIGYELERSGHAASPAGVTLLPPHVPHDGRPMTADGFRKRVIYLEEAALEPSLIGAAVDTPLLKDPSMRRAVSRLDRALIDGEDLEAESRLALVTDSLVRHLARRRAKHPAPPVAAVARQAREILDADPAVTQSVAAVADHLGVSAAHLVRSFTHSYGIAPHRYVIGRRLDLARHRLLAGEAAADVAITTGFYDQAHLTRHFKRLLGTTPGAYQRSNGNGA